MRKTGQFSKGEGILLEDNLSDLLEVEEAYLEMEKRRNEESEEVVSLEIKHQETKKSSLSKSSPISLILKIKKSTCGYRNMASFEVNG